MKTIAFITLCLISTLSFASSSNVENPKWVGVLWGYKNQDPIIAPIIYNSEKECMDDMKKFNEAAKNTVKIDRKYKCNAVYKPNK